MKEKIKDLLQREFNQGEALVLLKTPINIYWSWGVEEIVAVDNLGLILKVNGHHWKHYVLVTLDWSDTFTVTLLDADYNPIKSIREVYFDQLQTIIDKEIEYIDAYEK